MARFTEDGLDCQVDVIEDNSDTEWYRYKLKILSIQSQSPFCSVDIGDVFDVEQSKQCGWGGMWHLRDYDKKQNTAPEIQHTTNGLQAPALSEPTTQIAGNN